MAIFEKFERPRSHSKALDDLISRAYADEDLTHQQKAVLICLAWHAKNRAGEAYPSQATLSRMTGICVSLVGRAITYLAQRGYIEKKDRHRHNGGRTSSLITIHGMQYFPEDYQANLPGASEDKNPKATTKRPMRDTDTPGTTYTTMKEGIWKQDLPRNPTEAEATGCINGTKIDPLKLGESTHQTVGAAEQRKTEPNARTKETARQLKSFLAYLAANRQSLTASDFAAIKAFEARSDYQEGRALLASTSDEQLIHKQLQDFFLKRSKRMAAPSATQMDQIRTTLTALPTEVATAAIKRTDAIYKPSWTIPPNKDHFLATIADDLRAITLFRNAEIAFNDAKKTFIQRQQQRGLPSPQTGVVA